jgi:4-hydroxybenzoate polyprenyltransferase
MDLNRLAFFLLECFLLIGVAANYLDEIRGRPWNTTIQISVLWAVGIGALIASSLIGLYLALEIGLWFLPLVAAWAFLTASYSLELFNGKLHNALTLGSLIFLASLGAVIISGVKPTWVSIVVALLSAFVAGYGRQQYEVGKPAGRDNKFLPSAQRIWRWLMLEIVFIDAVAALNLAARIR